jgi:hypothetical protein
MAAIKTIGVSVDIRSAPDTVGNAKRVSLINTHTAGALVVVVSTGHNFYIGAGERVIVEKAASDQLDGGAGGASIWATPVAYRG